MYPKKYRVSCVGVLNQGFIIKYFKSFLLNVRSFFIYYLADYDLASKNVDLNLLGFSILMIVLDDNLAIGLTINYLMPLYRIDQFIGK